MATKASALCGALPSTPCCGCCSCAPRSGTEVFALGWSRIPLGHRSSCTRPPSWLVLHSPSCLCCLPGRPLFPCLLVSACLLPPAPSLCLVLSARLVVRWLWFVLLAWPVFCLVGFVWCFCVLVVSGWFLFFASCFCWLHLTSVWTGTFVYFAFTCTTKALIDHCTCVSVRRLDRFTCTVDFHRSTTS